MKSDSFTFSCPACGQHITALSSDVGAKSNCPTCNGELVVPDQATQQPLSHNKKNRGGSNPLLIPLATVSALLVVAVAVIIIQFSSRAGQRKSGVPVLPKAVESAAKPGSSTNQSPSVTNPNQLPTSDTITPPVDAGQSSPPIEVTDASEDSGLYLGKHRRPFLIQRRMSTGAVEGVFDQSGKKIPDVTVNAQGRVIDAKGRDVTDNNPSQNESGGESDDPDGNAKDSSTEPKPGERWQNDWSEFVVAYQKAFQEGETVKSFVGKEVSWSGRFEKTEPLDGEENRGLVKIALDPPLVLRGEFSIDSVVLDPSVEDWPQWKNLKPGEAVRFKTTLSKAFGTMDAPIVALNMVSGARHAALFVEGGTLLK